VSSVVSGSRPSDGVFGPLGILLRFGLDSEFGRAIASKPCLEALVPPHPTRSAVLLPLLLASAVGVHPDVKPNRQVVLLAVS